MQLIKNIAVAIFLATSFFVILEILYTISLRILYGSGYEQYYKRASIKHRCIHGHKLKRNMSIKIYVPSKIKYFEGKIIGFDYSNNILIRLFNGDIIMFPFNQIRKDDIVYAMY